MAHESARSLNFYHGNLCWHFREAEDGHLTFQTPGLGEKAGFDNLFMLYAEEVGALGRESRIYAPDSWKRRRVLPPGGECIQEVVFAPGSEKRAIMTVSNHSQKPLPIRWHVQTWFWEGYNDCPLLYPVWDPVRGLFAFERNGFHVRLKPVLPKGLPEPQVSKVWHSSMMSLTLSPGESAVLLAVFGLTAEEAEAELAKAEEEAPALRAAATAWWDDFFRSCPLVRFGQDFAYRNDLFGSDDVIPADEILRRQLWHYYLALIGILDVPWKAATPIQIADRIRFAATFTNDDVFGVLALHLTNKALLARQHWINLVRYMVREDGALSSVLFCSGARAGSYWSVHGLPAFPHAIAHYIRCTGDNTILDADAGGLTVWEKITLYLDSVVRHRDSNGDGLIEFNHVMETGWDNKETSVFADKGMLEWMRDGVKYPEWPDHPEFTDFARPATVISDNVYHLFSLEAAAWMAVLRNVDGARWTEQHGHILTTLRERHWNDVNGFYHDWDTKRETFWPTKNLDAFYFLWFETDPARRARLIKHLESTEEFNLTQLPTVACDEARFQPESYWAGASWPREQAFVVLGLAHTGESALAQEWAVRTLCCSPGPMLPEYMNPLTNPATPLAHVHFMLMGSVNQVALLEAFGLETWLGPVRNDGAVHMPETSPLARL